MNLKSNATHVYLTRSMAREAAIDAGYDLEDVHFFLSESDMWGWCSTEEAELVIAASDVSEEQDEDDDYVEPTSESLIARNAERMQEALALDVDETPVQEPEFVESSDVALPPSDPPMVEPVSEPDQGALSYTLVIKQTYTKDEAVLTAKAAAKKLGLEVFVCRTDTMEKIHREIPQAKATRASKNSGPTEQQAILISLCSRVDLLGTPIGATSKELQAAGAAGPNREKNTTPWRQLALGCERHGYKFRVGSKLDENSRVVTVYILEQISESTQDNGGNYAV